MTSVEKKPVFFQRFSDDALRAQIEAGNITLGDIQVLQETEDRINLYKNVGLFGTAAMTALYGRFYRKPPWPVWRAIGLSAAGGMAGLGISSVVALRILFYAPNKLEDQERFKVAVKALREDVTRRPGMRGPPQRRSPELSNESGGDPVAGASWSDSQMTTSNPDNTGHQESGPSTWDEIRKAQGVTHTSSWDRLREERQKADIKANPSSGPVPPSPPKPGQQTIISDTDKEMTEQERFDALLEAERKLGEEQKGSSGGFNRWN